MDSSCRTEVHLTWHRSFIETVLYSNIFYFSLWSFMSHFWELFLFLIVTADKKANRWTKYDEKMIMKTCLYSTQRIRHFSKHWRLAPPWTVRQLCIECFSLVGHMRSKKQDANLGKQTYEQYKWCTSLPLKSCSRCCTWKYIKVVNHLNYLCTSTIPFTL